MLLSYLSAIPLSYVFHDISYPCSARHSSLYLQCFPSCCLLQLLLLLFLLHCYFHKTVTIDKLLRARLLSGAAELTTHLLRLISILWLPLCRINKLGFTSLEDCGDPIYLWVITASPRSFISKLFEKKDLTSFITFMFVPNIRISSTYKRSITPSPSPWR